MYQFLLTIHFLIALAIVGLVLIQHGKGAAIGAAFGSGASSTVFGSQGSGTFLQKLTGGLAVLFFITSITLSHVIARESHKNQSWIPQVEQSSSDVQGSTKDVSLDKVGVGTSVGGSQEKRVELPKTPAAPAQSLPKP